MKTEIARVVVIGTSCVGKTTFARSLARVLSFPHVELDALYWQPHWVPRPSEEFRKLVAQELSQGCWVTDGNYSVVRDLVWSRATIVIWLNYSFSIVPVARAHAHNATRADARRTVLGQPRIAAHGFLQPRVDFVVGSYHLSSAAQAVSPAV